MRDCRLIVCFCLLAAATLPVSGAETGQEVPLSEVLARNHQAVRGGDQVDIIATVDIRLRIVESGGNLHAHYRAAKDGAMRIDVFADGQRVLSEGIDSNGAWEWPAGNSAPASIKHDGVAALEHGVEFNLHTLVELGGRGHEIELVDRESLRDEQYFVLKITLQDGFETFRYVNENTWLVDASRDYRALHPGVDITRKVLETRFDQWTETDGIRYAGRSRVFDTATGELLETVLVLDCRYNLPRSDLHLTRSFVAERVP